MVQFECIMYWNPRVSQLLADFITPCLCLPFLNGQSELRGLENAKSSLRSTFANHNSNNTRLHFTVSLLVTVDDLAMLRSSAQSLFRAARAKSSGTVKAQQVRGQSQQQSVSVRTVEPGGCSYSKVFTKLQRMA